MTQDQFMAMLRQLLPALGGLALGLGIMSPDQIAKWTSIVLQIAGPLSVLVGVIWAMVANNKSSIVQSVASMPETNVRTTPSGKVVIEVDDPNLAAKAVEAQDKVASIT